jgi:SAM-dependent methyltransferase
MHTELVDPPVAAPAVRAEPASEPTRAAAQRLRCRFCATPLRHTMVDLGMSPLCQTHIAPHELDEPETFYPLCARVCSQCYLVQLPEFVTPQGIFGEYAYFSSYSSSWVEHARRYCEMVTARFGLGAHSRVIEVASNDGYLLQHLQRAGVPVLGIEPAANVARTAIERGIPTLVDFLGRRSGQAIAAAHGRADLVLGNNVLAHVPDINDFVCGLRELLAPQGVITLEFPHLQRLMECNQFDTIYHEHFSYLSLTTVREIFASHGLLLFDVEELPTHGGSIRIYARHALRAGEPISPRVHAMVAREQALGLRSLARYESFGQQVHETKRRLLSFLIEARAQGRRVVGYGAPGKGNTLLNYCGIRTDLLEFTVDANPYKQGKFTPGTRIPILPPEALFEARPDYVLILPWNLRDEIMEAAAGIRAWGGQFVVPIPQLQVLP